MKRRGNAEGSILKRKTCPYCGKINSSTGEENLKKCHGCQGLLPVEGTWMGQVSLGVDPTTGKRKRKSFYGKTRKELAVKINRALSDLQAGTFCEPSSMTLGQWMEKWLSNYKKGELSKASFEVYSVTVKAHVYPGLGLAKLKNLQGYMLQEFLNDKLKEGLSAATVRHLYILINGALKQAVEENLIAKNPAISARPPAGGNSKADKLDEKQLQVLMETVKEDRLAAAFILAVNTGLRRGELLGLTWDCIDLENKTVTINKQLLMTGGRPVLEDSTKSSAGKRSIAISENAARALKKHQLMQKEERLKQGTAYRDNNLVFCKEDGSLINPKVFSKKFVKLLKKAGLPAIRFHDLRHSHASLLLSRGVHPKVVQERLGHSSISVTLDRYSHLVPGLQEQAAAEINELFNLEASN